MNKLPCLRPLGLLDHKAQEHLSMKVWLWELLIPVLWLMYNSLHQHFHRDMEITSRLICIMILVHVKNFELINHA